MNGVINVLKPPGMTSHDVVSAIRKIYGLKRVGHAGTLDPAAAGVLPVFLGSSARLIEYLAEAGKSYRALVTFGIETDTGDDTGKIIKKINNFAIPAPSVMEEVLASFIGEIDQLPPMYSAIKIQGKKLYELARRGITIERKPRKVTIYSLNLVRMVSAGILIDITCSKGTYIRTLCQDIGEKLGLPATMSFLVRTKVGKFNLDDTWTLEEIENDKSKACLPADSFLDMPVVRLDAAELVFFQNGRSSIINCPDKLPADFTVDASLSVKITNRHDKFIGIGRFTKLSGGKGQLIPVKVLQIPEQTDGDK